MKCLVLLLLMINLVFAKKYERCELAKELYGKHNVTMEDVGMWVCIAETRSNLNTALSSKFNGLFGISSKFWCLENEVGGGCIMKCSDLSDDDIADDVKCAKRIVSVEGFNAFVLLETCNSKSREIITECFGNVLNLDKCTNSVNITSEVKETESTLSNKGTIEVELVNLLADSIKSLGASPTSSKFNGGTPLTINNYIMFNINGDGVKKIKISNTN